MKIRLAPQGPGSIPQDSKIIFICSKTSMNLQDPRIREMPKLEHVIRGVKREHAKQSPGKRVRLPITPEILLKLRGVWEARSKNHNAIMLWGACCLCYFGFLRAGEVTVSSEAAYDPGEHLNFADVAVDSISTPQLLKVKISVKNRLFQTRSGFIHW